MGKISAVLFLAATVVLAQGDAPVEAAAAIDRETCEELRDRVIPRIEAFARMRFRRPVPIKIRSKADWVRSQEQDGYAGHSATHAVAFYSPHDNEVTVVPWAIGRYPVRGGPGTPLKMTRAEWVRLVEPTLIHELVHAIHHQNFFIDPRTYDSSLRMEGLTEEEIDATTVDFLLGEGFPEFVSLRTTEYPKQVGRYPADQLAKPSTYMRVYTPDGTQPFRITLFDNGYDDGLTLLHHLFLKAGARGVRAALYRPPPRLLLFLPEILGAVELDDPPDPDSILGFLAPEILEGHEVHLAVDPGAGRYFLGAWRTHRRARGCLIGYAARVAGAGDYAFYVADPERPGRWSAEQAEALKALHPPGARRTRAGLPLMPGAGVKAHVLRVKTPDQGLYVRAEAQGLVVLAHEEQPTSNLVQRVLGALRVLYLKRPKAKLYEKALAQARAKLEED